MCYSVDDKESPVDGSEILKKTDEKPYGRNVIFTMFSISTVFFPRFLKHQQPIYAPCREYLPTFPLECGHFSPNVGKYSLHGASGQYCIPNNND